MYYRAQKPKYGWIIISTALMTALVVGSGVYFLLERTDQEVPEADIGEVEDLEQELQEQYVAVRDLEEENQQLKARNQELSLAIDRLEDEDRALLEENASLKGRVERLEEENEALRAENRALELENDRLEEALEGEGGSSNGSAEQN